MKIATWNVNSLKVRLPQVLEWLAANEDITALCLQETKLEDINFPQAEIEADRRIREKTYKHAMFCSICGSSMVLRRNKLTCEEFYGCSRYPACNGTDQIEYKPEEKTGFFNPVESLTKRSHDHPRQPQHTSHRASDELNRRWKEIVLLAEQKCGSSSQAAIWIETPKISFRGRKPMDLLGTLEGCDLVESMLNEL